MLWQSWSSMVGSGARAWARAGAWAGFGPGDSLCLLAAGRTAASCALLLPWPGLSTAGRGHPRSERGHRHFSYFTQTPSGHPGEGVGSRARPPYLRFDRISRRASAALAKNVRNYKCKIQSFFSLNYSDTTSNTKEKPSLEYFTRRKATATDLKLLQLFSKEISKPQIRYIYIYNIQQI